MCVSKCEVSKALEQTETPLETENSHLKMLIHVSGQERTVYKLCTFLILQASQHQFTPAPVHSTGLIWFSLIASSLNRPAALVAGDQPGVKWPWPPSPVLMAGEGGIQTTAATAWRFLKWEDTQQLPATLVFRSALIQRTGAKLSSWFGGSSSMHVCFLTLFFSYLVILQAKSGWLYKKKKVCLLIFKNQMSYINQFNLKFVYCGTVDGQHMRQEEKKKFF